MRGLPPDAEKTLSRLKDFQRQSVDYVFRRLYTDPDQVDRFLLADEVGLGKTLVARGTVARAVAHLWETVDRIDIVYICSNADIARQNIKRLKLEGQDDFAFASRLTLLALRTKDFDAPGRINLISFTPSTSFDVGSGGGIMEERALLYALLEGPWELRGTGPKNVLQGGAGTERWRVYLKTFLNEKRHQIDDEVAHAFMTEVNRASGLRKKFADLCGRFQRERATVPNKDRCERNRMVGTLRRMLARCCVKQLQPDLVILDEFQRFRHLLGGAGDKRAREMAELAGDLFDYGGESDARARVLLLSATPYKMYTLAHDTDEDHYRDFLQTTGFLFGSDEATAAFERELRTYRASLSLGAEMHPQLLLAKAAIERRLRKVMCRTERLAVSADRNGMLSEIPMAAAPVKTEDIQAFMWLDRLAVALGAVDHIELWKSGAYLANFMEDYDLKRKLRQACDRNDTLLRRLLQERTAALFGSQAVERYEAVDPGNGRMRALLDESIGRGGWKLLWIPASLPYYAPGGFYADPSVQGFTKALVFSSWRVAPKVIGVLGSYEAERRMVRSGSGSLAYSELRERQRALLRFAQEGARLTGMPLFTLLYPCVTLAMVFDPLDFGQRRSAGTGTIPTVSEVLGAAAAEVERCLGPALDAARAKRGPPDERWYWAAPLLLDRERCPEVARWLDARDDWSWEGWKGLVSEEDTHFAQHVQALRGFFGAPQELGPPPRDLIQVLAKTAIASPAIAALRALARRSPKGLAGLVQRVKGRGDGGDQSSAALVALLGAAAWIGNGFQTLFNRPETILLVRDSRSAQPYWERVLDYAVDGNLQAVMDEYVHVLNESLGLEDAGCEAVRDLAHHLHAAVTLRTVTLSHDEFSVGAREIAVHPHRMRCRYALRFGDGESEDGGEVTREDQVRSAFNSPFRPFILASTSVGQEGLDFHPYCHAVYHWNLPSNPVDLEQREGRINRYKGHVIRKNLASRYDLGRTTGNPDPWSAVFALAADARQAGVSELVPYWIAEGPWKIERRIPLFRLSRETQRLEDLKRSLALYRLVFGQPRQEELLRLLQDRVRSGVSMDTLLQYQVDLTPTAGGA